MQHELAKTLDAMGDFEGAAAAAAKAVELDPKFALALATLSQEQTYLGRFTEARATIARCVEVSPAASWCLWVGEFIDSDDGNCEANEASAHSRIATQPLVPDGYKELAYSFAALGRPEKAIREACDRAVQRVPEGFNRQRLDLNLKFRIAAMYGRFDEANELGAQLRKLVESRTDRGDHALPALITSELALELGDKQGAAAIAKDFLDRRDAWLSNPVPNDYALANDPTAPILAIARRSGAISDSDYQSRLRDWRDKWSKDLRGGWRPYLWVYGYAAPASTKDEGAEAVKALDALGPVPPFMSDGDMPHASVGRALLLGGRTSEAITYLRRAAKSCDALTRPLTWVQTHAQLGDALTEAKDTKGACEAYAVVVGRWGAAKKSVTARHARERMTALHCPMR
jgi:serine/threonine-protein kinase